MLISGGTGARPCSTTGENLIQLEEAIPGTTYYRVPRYYTYGQFTRFIEAGSHRVDVEAIPSEENQFPAELLMSAYVKDNTLYHRISEQFGEGVILHFS